MAKRRSILLLDPKFQLRFSFYVCSWILALSLLFPAVIYSLFEWIIMRTATHMTPEVRASLNDIQSDVFWNLVLLEATYMGLIVLISLFLSHRIVGPIYKLRKYLHGATNGNLLADLKFRKADHFQDLATDYNAMITGVRNRIHAGIETVSTSIARIETVLPLVDGETKKELEAALTDLRKVRDKISL